MQNRCLRTARSMSNLWTLPFARIKGIVQKIDTREGEKPAVLFLSLFDIFYDILYQVTFT